MLDVLRPISTTRDELLENECNAYCSHINQLLSQDQDFLSSAYLPLTPATLFEKLRDGVLLASVMHQLFPGSIDLERIEKGIDMSILNQPASKAVFQVTANLNLCIQAARNAKLVVVNLGAHDILEGNRDLVLGLLWQIIRGSLLAKISLAAHPELVRLLEPGESLEQLVASRAEPLLIRWVNYHLARANVGRRISNLSKDLSDAECYLLLFRQIAPEQIDEKEVITLLEMKVETLEDRQARAEAMLCLADKLDCRQFVTSNDVAAGHPRLNLAFTATLFNRHVGIHLPTEDETRRLQAELERQQAVIVSLRETLNTANENEDNELNLLRDELQKAKSQLESERAHHASQIENLRVEFARSKEELGAQFSESLESTLAVERRNHVEAIFSLRSRLRELRRQLSCLLTLMRPATLNDDCKASEAFRLIDEESEPEELLRLVADLSGLIIQRNRELTDSTTSLQGTIQRKEHINEVMGAKIREFTEQLIQKKKSQRNRTISVSPLQRLFSVSRH